MHMEQVSGFYVLSALLIQFLKKGSLEYGYLTTITAKVF